MENPDLAVVNMFVQALFESGVTQVCISPGSRSTPLTMAMARQGKMKLWTILDERSAGFFALGLAKRTQTPVALVCTSGTATANYHPALMEARYARVPLIVLTADRPPELRGTGSNQTVDQVKMYGDHVKWYAELPVPDNSSIILAHAAAIATRAIVKATHAPMGPVHVNVPFREPLIPPYESSCTSETSLRRQGPKVYMGKQQFTSEMLTEVSHWFADASRPVIVCGPISDKAFAKVLLPFADKLAAPIFADPLSQLRTQGEDVPLQPCLIDTYDIWMADQGRLQLPKPDLIIRFGGMPTSKVLAQTWLNDAEIRHVVVDTSEEWVDPFFVVSDFLHVQPSTFCADILPYLPTQCNREWVSGWLEKNTLTQTVLAQARQGDSWNEAMVWIELHRLLPPECNLFVGNSMPVRDMDAFFTQTDKKQTYPNLRVFANRGASGIDGVVSTALGVSAGSHSDKTVLVIGDVSFFHDLNGLLAASKYALNLLVVLIHNDGGGIFSFLSQAQHPDTFAYFRTAHGLDFAPIVGAYGGRFQRISDWKTFREQVVEALHHGGLQVLELRMDIEENVTFHREIREAVISTLEGLV